MAERAEADPPAADHERGGRETGRGAAFALAAFGFWGLNPLYFKLVDRVPMLEVLAHRDLENSIFADSDPTRILAVPVDAFDTLLDQDVDFARRVLALESQRLQDLMQPSRSAV